MNSNPNNDQNNNNEPQVVQVTSLPLTVLVSGFMNAVPAFEWILNATQILVVLYFAYYILGRALFVAIIVTPALAVFVSSMFSSYEMIVGYQDDDSEDDDDGFGNHWNNNLK